MLSKRGQNSLDNPALMEYLMEHFARAGSEGYVPACVAESILMEEELATRMESVPAIPHSKLHYGPMIGDEDLREAILRLMEARGVYPAGTFGAGNVAVLAGVGTVLEMTFFGLADPGEAVLVPTPSYAGFWMDLCTRNELSILPVHRDPPGEAVEDGFVLSVDALDAVWAQAEEDGVVVRALLLCNPDNPLGSVYGAEEIKALLAWARGKGIHVVFDEIYALSVFDASAGPFTSAAAVLGPEGLLGQDTHIMWGVSKDLGAGGLRCGALITPNTDLIEAVNQISYWGASSRHTQWTLTNILSDLEWMDTFLTTSHARLAEAYGTVTRALDAAGIPYVPAVSAIFLLIDLRAYLEEATFDSEHVLWSRLLNEVGINITPGSELRSESPGWFRLCYAAFPSPQIADKISLIPTLLPSP